MTPDREHFGDGPSSCQPGRCGICCSVHPAGTAAIAPVRATAASSSKVRSVKRTSRWSHAGVSVTARSRTCRTTSPTPVHGTHAGTYALVALYARNAGHGCGQAAVVDVVMARVRVRIAAPEPSIWRSLPGGQTPARSTAQQARPYGCNTAACVCSEGCAVSGGRRRTGRGGPSTSGAGGRSARRHRSGSTSR
jgi:hypothetical protein